MMLDGFTNVLVLAQGGAPAGPSMVAQLIPIGIILLVFYFLMWRPQAKRQEAHQKFVDALKRGDDVVTEGGMIGTVTSVDDKTVTVDLGKGTKVRFLKQSIRGTKASIVDGSEGGDEE
jgi:preprotein translocase subunit YajC